MWFLVVLAIIAYFLIGALYATVMDNRFYRNIGERYTTAELWQLTLAWPWYLITLRQER